MKKTLIISLSIIAMLFSLSCRDNIQITNSPAVVVLKVLKDNVDIWNDKDNYRDNILANTLKINVIPEVGSEFILSTSSSKEIYTALHLPLMSNSKYKCSGDKCRKFVNDIQPEIFRLVVKNNEQVLFNKKLMVEYKIAGFPFPGLKKISFLNENGVWETYRSSKIPILDENNKPTGYDLQTPLWEDWY